jgi:hypothetical protein
VSPTDWAGLAVSIVTLLSALAMGVRHLVKHFLSELKPNGGSSIRDKVDVNTARLERLEQKVDNLYQILIQK